MTLSGTYSRNIDEQFRLAVPKRLREQFSEGKISHLYLAPGTERSLALYSETAFEKLAQRLSERTTNRTDFRNYLRLFYARAEKVPLDSQGRIRIPERLHKLADLGRDVVLLGVHDHVEIWNTAHWDAFLAKHSANFDDMATQAFEA
jgi:MraZ protein